MKKAISALLGTGFLLATSAAAAQQYGWSGSYQPGAPPPSSASTDNIGAEGQIVFGVDRVMGLAFDRLKSDAPSGNGSTTSKTTTVALFGQGADQSGLFPRLALDYFPIESLSIGGSFVYLHKSNTVDTDNGTTTTSTDGPSTSTVIFAPRIGYAYAFDETFAIWPRAGVTYVHSTTTTTTTNPITNATTSQDTTFSGFDLTAELMFGISPFNNFAILLGPYVDFPLSGTASIPATPPATGSTDIDTKLTSFGLATSIVGYMSP